METEFSKWVSPDSGRQLRLAGEFLEAENGERFRIINRIPRFVADESYTKNFGDQWKRFGMTQMDSRSGLDETEVRLRRCLGEDLWARLDGLEILECGCGAGRFTEILLARGARVVSVDLSEAVDVNAANFPVGPRHLVAQADILKLPFERRRFDAVVCLGVIQHTPDPEATITALAEQVRPGGSIVIDHYTFTRAYLSLRVVYRPLLKRLPHSASMNVLAALAPIFLPLHRAFRGPSAAAVFASKILNRVSPFVTYYRAFPKLSDAQQREWALLDSHDSLTDWFKHFRNVRQLRAHLESLGFRDLHCTYGGNGVEARGSRPLDSHS